MNLIKFLSLTNYFEIEWEKEVLSGSLLERLSSGKWLSNIADWMDHLGERIVNESIFHSQ